MAGRFSRALSRICGSGWVVVVREKGEVSEGERLVVCVVFVSAADILFFHSLILTLHLFLSLFRCLATSLILPYPLFLLSRIHGLKRTVSTFSWLARGGYSRYSLSRVLFASKSYDPSATWCEKREAVIG